MAALTKPVDPESDVPPESSVPEVCELVSLVCEDPSVELAAAVTGLEEVACASEASEDDALLEVSSVVELEVLEVSSVVELEVSELEGEEQDVAVLAGSVFVVLDPEL